MVLTVTLNPAIDKIIILNHFELHKLHRLEPGEQSLMTPGGKGVNIARNLKKLGNEVIASGFAGGHRGHMLSDYLRREGIFTNFIFTDKPTRTNLSILDLKNKTLTEINDIGFEIDKEDTDFFIENYKRLLNRVQLVVIAGSPPKGLPDSVLTELIMLAQQQDKQVFLHTPPKYSEHTLNPAPYLFLPDMRSHHYILGRDIDGIEDFLVTGKNILKKHQTTQIVIFTHRIENVVAITREMSFIVRPKELEIVNMLGYGDAYLAGFIHAHLKGKELFDKLKYASACGLTDVEDLYKEIQNTEKIEQNLNRIEIEVVK